MDDQSDDTADRYDAFSVCDFIDRVKTELKK